MAGALKVGLFGLSCSELSKPPSHRIHGLSKRSLCVAVSRIGNEAIGEDIMRTFVMERQANGDFITKVTDLIWRRDELKLDNPETGFLEENHQQLDEVANDEDVGGFLKLTQTRAWVSGEDVGPVNKRLAFKDWQNEVEKRKKLNLLKYEALKGELLFLTIGIGAACSAYCLIVLSVEAGISYAAGVLFSCLYLQLLFYQADNLSEETVSDIFMQKRAKKIGIRSEDLKYALEKTLKGSAMALSSPRLVIPAAIYGLWALSHRFSDTYFDFQLVPGMFGFFAYKAAALVQVYRDNEDLLLVFPDQEEF